MEYKIVYKGRNWPSDIDGPNVALTVVRDGEYFKFYIALFPAAVALDLVVGAGPHPRDMGGRWYQALTRAAIEEIERDIRGGRQPDPDMSKRTNATLIYPDPARVRALERGTRSTTRDPRRAVRWDSGRPDPNTEEALIPDTRIGPSALGGGGDSLDENGWIPHAPIVPHVPARAPRPSVTNLTLGVGVIGLTPQRVGNSASG